MLARGNVAVGATAAIETWKNPRKMPEASARISEVAAAATPAEEEEGHFLSLPIFNIISLDFDLISFVFWLNRSASARYV